MPKTATPTFDQAEALDLRTVMLFKPESQVRITEMGAVKQGYRNFECISFVNLGPKTAVRVAFRFYYFDAQKALVGSDTLTRTGQFTTGIEDKGPVEQMGQVHAADQVFNLLNFKSCIPFTIPKMGIAYDVASVERIDYQDGSSWVAPPDAPSPSPSPTGAKPI